MPEIKNTFLKSKMNKDLDARIVPNGEYRDAQNLSVSKSEGADVGSLENILGNTILTDLKNKIKTLEAQKLQTYYTGATIRSSEIQVNQLEIIGYYVAVSIDTVFLFLTDYRDSSNNQLINFAPADQGASSGPGTYNFYYKGAMCYIAEYNIKTNNTKILIGGNFLNFSKTHPILNVNLLENLLFWTDNRNQPRKININTASLELSSNGSWETWEGSRTNYPYYYNEDHISVAKFAPYNCFEFVDSSNNSTLISNSEEFLPAHIATSLLSSNKSIGDTVIDISGQYVITGNNPDISANDKLEIRKGEEVEEYTVSSVVINGANTDITLTSGLVTNISYSNSIILISRKNPDYNTNYKGDTNLMKDKFSKFSYRFKYDDDEYSLMAPFTQAAFVPKQFGYFIDQDEQTTLESGNVRFVENFIDEVRLNLQLPYSGNEIEEKLKVKEIQILIKNSDEQAVRVIEDIEVSRLGSSTTYEYKYLSTRPTKTLPEADLIRVHDKIPVRALTQELISNRIVYGNYLDKHSSPDNVNYELNYVSKNISNANNPVTGRPANLIAREMPTHTLKQNRSYQVGIVLVDRYGRSSNVILNDPDNIAFGKNSTIYAPYNNYNDPAFTQFFGKQLDFTLRTPIPNSIANKINYPGLYSETNPLGYYSYRIVVKQQEQEYYNVYTPGALAGELTWNTVGFTKDNTSAQPTSNEPGNSAFLPSFSNTNKVSLINLFGDNINKVPRELEEINGNDAIFSSRVLLYNRVNHKYNSTDLSYNEQSVVSKKSKKVISIEPFKNLGEWTTTKGKLFPGENIPSDATTPVPTPWYPYHVTEPTSGNFEFNFYDIFLNAQANPFIAKIETDFKIGSTPEYTNKESIERSFQNLGVFETEPIKSSLDIYFESSTSGLLTDFNLASEDAVPAGIKDSDNNQTILGQNINYIHDEGANASASSPVDATQELFITDSSGGTITSSFDVTIQSVIDGTGQPSTSDFIINKPTTSSFKIQVISKKVFLLGSNVRQNYTFNLGFTDTSNPSNPIWTGAFPLQLNNCQMQNVAPSWLFQPTPTSNNIQYERILTSDQAVPTILTIVRDPSVTPSTGNVRASNGSAITERTTEQVIYEVVGVQSYSSQGPLGADAFEITENVNPLGNIDLRVTPTFYSTKSIFAPVDYTYQLRLKAIDANGSGEETLSDAFLVTLKLI